MISVNGSAEDITPLIARSLIDSGYPIVELSLESRDLETVFREINEKQTSPEEIN